MTEPTAQPTTQGAERLAHAMDALLTEMEASGAGDQASYREGHEALQAFWSTPSLAQPAAQGTKFPRATGAAKDGGWTLDFGFIEKVRDQAAERSGYHGATLEEVEAIILFVEQALASAHQPAAAPSDVAVALWKLLDDIDTLDDACKSDDAAFRKSVYAVQQKRHQIMSGEDFDRLAALPPTITAAREAGRREARLEDIETVRGLYRLSQSDQSGKGAERRGAYDNVLTQLTRAAALPAMGERYRHKKRGTTYTLLASLRPLQTTRSLSEGAPIAIYQGEDGQLWARWQADFDDGRFERIPATGEGSSSQEGGDGNNRRSLRDSDRPGDPASNMTPAASEQSGAAEGAWTGIDEGPGLANQVTDLQEANSRYLQRARDAETEITALKTEVERLGCCINDNAAIADQWHSQATDLAAKLAAAEAKVAELQQWKDNEY